MIAGVTEAIRHHQRRDPGGEMRTDRRNYFDCIDALLIELPGWQPSHKAIECDRESRATSELQDRSPAAALVKKSLGDLD